MDDMPMKGTKGRNDMTTTTKEDADHDRRLTKTQLEIRAATVSPSAWSRSGERAWSETADDRDHDALVSAAARGRDQEPHGPDP